MKYTFADLESEINQRIYFHDAYDDECDIDSAFTGPQAERPHFQFGVRYRNDDEGYDVNGRFEIFLPKSITCAEKWNRIPNEMRANAFRLVILQLEKVLNDWAWEETMQEGSDFAIFSFWENPDIPDEVLNDTPIVDEVTAYDEETTYEEYDDRHPRWNRATLEPTEKIDYQPLTFNEIFAKIVGGKK